MGCDGDSLCFFTYMYVGVGMTAREYLWQLKHIDKRIEHKIEEAQKWRDIATNVSSRISDEKVQTTHQPDKMANAIVNAVEYERESEEMARKLTDFKHKVTLQIDKIEDVRYYDVLKYFFVMDLTYVDIQSKMDRSYRHVRREVDKAIEEFGRVYADEIEHEEKITGLTVKSG